MISSSRFSLADFSGSAYAALRIAMKMAEGDWLFPFKPSWNSTTQGLRTRTGQVLSAKGADERIQDFVAYANQLAEQHDLAAERIPDDPDGKLVLRRFRRTVAWAYRPSARQAHRAGHPVPAGVSLAGGGPVLLAIATTMIREAVRA
jgi:hypothetical protein